MVCNRYAPRPSPLTQKLAALLIEAGADPGLVESVLWSAWADGVDNAPVNA